MKRVLSLLLALSILLSAGVCTRAADAYGDEPAVAAKAALLYECGSGEMLYSKAGSTRLYPASTTKIMTALLLLEHGHLSDTVTVSSAALSAVPADSSLAGLRAGEKLTLADLLICMLVPSGNDAANVVAEIVGGSIPEFVDMMNWKARDLGCTDTHFTNAHGFHDPEHYTTAEDLLKITLAAMEYPLFVETCSKARATIPATNKSAARTFRSTNSLISNAKTSEYLYPYCIGGKTGTTTPAGNCLVAFARKDDLYLVSVMLGSRTETSRSGKQTIRSFSDTRALFDWGFSGFSWRTIVSDADTAAYVDVAFSAREGKVALQPERGLRLFLHRGVPDSDFTILMSLKRAVTAPVSKGEKLGTLSVYRKGELIDTQYLLADKYVARTGVLSALQARGRYDWAWWRPRISSFTNPSGFRCILTCWEPADIRFLAAASVS